MSDKIYEKLKIIMRSRCPMCCVDCSDECTDHDEAIADIRSLIYEDAARVAEAEFAGIVYTDLPLEEAVDKAGEINCRKVSQRASGYA